VWNENQTEAFLDTEGNGIFVPVTWTQNGASRSVDYKFGANFISFLIEQLTYNII
jgi:hypothetical protein